MRTLLAAIFVMLLSSSAASAWNYWRHWDDSGYEGRDEYGYRHDAYGRGYGGYWRHRFNRPDGDLSDDRRYDRDFESGRDWGLFSRYRYDRGYGRVD